MPVEPNSPRSNSSADETITIVRYPNRRFYDRSQGRYVTLQEIASMVREGKNVSVRDSKTNEDLTSTILMQIILENHPERMDVLPVPILHQMIRTNDIVLGLLRDYFRQSMLYLEFWQQAARFNPMATPMEWFKSLLPATGEPSNSPASGPNQAEAMSQRMADVERRMETFSSAPENPPQSNPDSGTKSPKKTRPKKAKGTKSRRKRREA